MAALWREHREMMKFGTLVVMAMNSDLTNFGVSIVLYSATTSSKIQHWNGNSSWTPCSRKMKLSTPDYSLHADHIQYHKTPPITVAAILKSTVFCLFATPPSKLIKFFPKLAQVIFGLSRTEMTEQIFLFIFVQKLWCCELNEVDPKLVQRLYLGQTLINRNETCTFLQHHDLRVHANVGNSATYGSWDTKNSHFRL